MTTIAYHHESRTIAVDGRVTADNLICCETFQKWREVDGAVWFLSGATCDFERLIAYHGGALTGKPEHKVSCSALVAVGGECFEMGVTADGEPWRSVAPYSIAIGSGRDHAMTAMDMGADARKAVEMAIKRDNCTGGKITVFNLATMQFEAAE